MTTILIAMALTSASFQISTEGIGNVVLGDTSVAVVSKYPKSTTVTEEQEGYPAEVIKVNDANGDLLFDAELDEGKVWRLSVHNPLFKTKEGFGTTTPFAQLRKAYGKHEFVKGEGITCAVFPKKRGLSFCLDKAKQKVNAIIVHNVRD